MFLNRYRLRVQDYVEDIDAPSTCPICEGSLIAR